MASMPMNVAAKPEPGIEMNGELKPVASAFASIVLPVPGAPRKSRPRSRFPPARSKASPDCQIETTRRTSSFASAWPRTSASLTPHSASPGSKPWICERFMRRSGPKRMTKLKMRKNGQDHEQREDLRRGAPRRGTRSTSRTIDGDDHERLTQKRQNQTRRRATTSSSRSCWLSRPKRLGRGISRWKRRSMTPRKQTTSAERGEDRPVPRPALVWLQPDDDGRGRDERDDGGGPRQPAPLAGELVRELGLLETPRRLRFARHRRSVGTPHRHGRLVTLLASRPCPRRS